MTSPKTESQQQPAPHVLVTFIPVPRSLCKKPHPIPSASDCLAEVHALLSLALPIALTALLSYSRSALSMLFLGSLGDLPLASGSLAIAFANISAYSVLSGLSLGMEPLCSQAFGAHNHKLLSLTLHRSVLFLLASSIPISLLWLHMSPILLSLGQDPAITSLAQTYLYFSLPDLLTLSFLHPLRVFLRSQGITRPLAFASFIAAVVHLPFNLLLVNYLHLGVRGVAAASALSNFTLLLALVAITCVSHTYIWQGPTRECLTGWAPLARLAAPSCLSVCLEWWWYELMILFCGLLPNPRPAVASMGVLIQTTSLLYVSPSSMGLAVSARVGNELGADEPGRAKASATVAMAASGLMGIAAMCFAVGVRGLWGGMFTRDEEIRRLTWTALPIVGLCEIGNCPQTVGCGVLRGSARPGDAANVNLGAFYLVGMPVAVGLGFGFRLGFCGLWVGLVAAQLCCAGLMFYVVGFTDWDVQAMRARALTAASGREEAEKGGGEPLISIIKLGQGERSDIVIEFEN